MPLRLHQSDSVKRHSARYYDWLARNMDRPYSLDGSTVRSDVIWARQWIDNGCCMDMEGAMGNTPYSHATDYAPMTKGEKISMHNLLRSEARLVKLLDDADYRAFIKALKNSNVILDVALYDESDFENSEEL